MGSGCLCQLFTLLKQNRTEQRPALARRAERGQRKGAVGGARGLPRAAPSPGAVAAGPAGLRLPWEALVQGLEVTGLPGRRADRPTPMWRSRSGASSHAPTSLGVSPRSPARPSRPCVFPHSARWSSFRIPAAIRPLCSGCFFHQESPSDLGLHLHCPHGEGPSAGGNIQNRSDQEGKQP